MRKLRSDSRANDPDFVPSLQLLIERERYSWTDIGLMFGVTRERVRQWAARYGIRHPAASHARGLMCVRVWDDDAARFRPVLKGVLKSDQRRLRQRRKTEERDARRSARQRQIIEAIVALKAQLGRDPTTGEMASAVSGRPVRLGQAGAYLAWEWDHRNLPTRKRYREAMAAICAAADMDVVRPRGTLSHVHDRASLEAIVP